MSELLEMIGAGTVLFFGIVFTLAVLYVTGLLQIIVGGIVLLFIFAVIGAACVESCKGDERKKLIRESYANDRTKRLMARAKLRRKFPDIYEEFSAEKRGE